jgi:hypothetical protein
MFMRSIFSGKLVALALAAKINILMKQVLITLDEFH